MKLLGRRAQTNVSLLKHYIDNYLSEDVKIVYLLSASCVGKIKRRKPFDGPVLKLSYCIRQVR